MTAYDNAISCKNVVDDFCAFYECAVKHAAISGERQIVSNIGFTTLAPPYESVLQPKWRHDVGDFVRTSQGAITLLADETAEEREAG